MWVTSKKNDFIGISKQRYQGRWDKRIMADYIWSIKKDLNNIEHNNQKKKNLP